MRGGPFTRVDPSDPSIKSCLDLVLISVALYDYVILLKIDEKRIMTPHRPVGENKRLIFSDHYSLYLIFENIPLRTQSKSSTEKHSVWNTNKEGGWEAYKDSTEDNYELNNLAIEDNNDSNEFQKKMEKIMNKIKFRCFGKVTFTNKCKIDKAMQ